MMNRYEVKGTFTDNYGCAGEVSFTAVCKDYYIRNAICQFASQRKEVTSISLIEEIDENVCPEIESIEYYDEFGGDYTNYRDYANELSKKMNE